MATTVRGYITAKLNRFEVNIEDAELDGLLSEVGADGDAVYDNSQIQPVKMALVKIIPEILLMPSITEGGYKVERSIEGLKAYYGLLCSDLGLGNMFDAPPTVSDISDYFL